MSAPARIVELEQENAQLSARLTSLSSDYDSLKHQLDWLKRQLFGDKSEKHLDIDPAVQGNLLSGLGVEPPPPKEPDTETITYQRRKKTRDGALNDSGLRFSDDVPRTVFILKDPEFESLPEDQREVIGEKVSFRLAQRPGSYLVLEYRRLVYKRLEDQKIVTTPAPANVLEKSSTDVSLLAGMLIDKFCYHLPLYPQHQRPGTGRYPAESHELNQLDQPCHRFTQTHRRCPVSTSAAKQGTGDGRDSDQSGKAEKRQDAPGRYTVMTMKSCSAMRHHAHTTMCGTG